MPHDRHQRRSIRLPHYDYSRPGYYYITICTQNRLLLFGEIVDAEMRLNRLGEIVDGCWRWLSHQYTYVALDEWMVMPDHFHGILVMMDGNFRRGGSRTAPTDIIIIRKPLGRLLGAFKTISTKKINQLSNSPGRRVWQRGYYEHVIRDEADLNAKRDYIMNNPLKWELDRNNPGNW